jgi:hypothetical protein
VNELEKIPSYLEAMRTCFADIWHVAEEKVENLKGEDARYVNCILFEFEQKANEYINLGKNLNRLCETRKTALFELMTDINNKELRQLIEDTKNGNFFAILILV